MKNKIIFSIIAILLLFIAGSCEREIESSDPVRSIPETGPIVTDLRAVINDQSITLTWDIINGTGISKYRVYQTTDDFFPIYKIVDSTSITSIDIENLQINTVYYFKVAAVTSEGLEWDVSDAITAQFTYLSISIANGDEYTNDRSVIVSINAPVETSHIMLSEDINFADVEFKPFIGTGTQFELSDGDGTKNVYCKLQFQNGSISGTALSDAIILDTKVEIASITYADPINGDYFQVGETITFNLDADEIDGNASVRFGSGSNSVALDLLDDGVSPDATVDDGIYSGSWDVPYIFHAYEEQVNGYFTDVAGNSAENLLAEDLIYIYTPPPSVSLTALTESTHEIRLLWEPTTSDNFGAYKIFRSTSAGVSDQSLQVEFMDSNYDNFTDSDLDDNTKYYYIIYTYDNSGLSSASNVVSTTTLINTAPEAVELFAEIETLESTVELNWSGSNEQYFDSYRIYRSKITPNITTSDDLVAFITSQSSLSATVPLDPTDSLADGSFTNYFKIYVIDGHDLMTGSNSVQVDIP